MLTIYANRSDLPQQAVSRPAKTSPAGAADEGCIIAKDVIHILEAEATSNFAALMAPVPHLGKFGVLVFSPFSRINNLRRINRTSDSDSLSLRH